MKPGIRRVTSAQLYDWLRHNLLLVITFSGISLGVVVGLCLRPYNLDAKTIDYIAYPGELFMRLLKLMILPLIIASLITGSCSTCPARTEKTGLDSITYGVMRQGSTYIRRLGVTRP